MKLKISIITSALVLLICNPLFAGSKKSPEPGQKKLTLMAYNVENLFDTEHDEGKDDWTFVPKNLKGKKEACAGVKHKYYQKQCYGTDWSAAKLEIKLNQIKKALDSVGKKIDLLALSEIENEKVIAMLAKKIGRKQFVVSNSPDKRGVDLALLYNESAELKKISSQEHEIPGEYFKKKPTRNILEVEFLVGGKHKLNVFVNHWPSQGNPSEARVAAANVLSKRVQAILKEDPERNIIATGDFNTIDRDNPHPLNSIVFKDHLLNDVGEITRSSGITGMGPEGTYFYYRGQVWNQLDRILISKTLLDQKAMELDVGSFRVHAPKLLKKGRKFNKKMIEVPYSYNFKANKADDAGFSDHFPVYAEFIY